MKTLPPRICTHWGFYWRCAVMQDAYSTALQTMYILMLDPYLSWRVLGHSVNKSHVIFAWLSSILPVSLTSSCLKKKKSFHFYRKFHSLLSPPLGWTLATPKASAHPVTSAPGLTPSSPREEWLGGNSLSIPGPTDMNYAALLKTQKRLKPALALNNFSPPFYRTLVTEA